MVAKKMEQKLHPNRQRRSSMWRPLDAKNRHYPFASTLRERMLKLNLTTEELSQRIVAEGGTSCTPKAVQKWARGENYPRAATLLLLAKVLKVKANDLAVA